MTDTTMEKTSRDGFGHFANSASGWLGSKWAFAAAGGVIVIWGLSGPLFHFSDTWQLVINTGTTIVTFLMVFLIQNVNQNTANFKLNYGMPHGFEIDVDSPYLAIYRAPGSQPSVGVGDTNLGIKKNFRKESSASRLPALSASFYVELPTGDASQQLGSGLEDYWLNLIAQKSISPKTRITANMGYLFAGNTSTGVLGTQTTQGHVFPGGISLQHDFRPSLTLGAELFGAYTGNGDLGRSQFQTMIGGHYDIRTGLSFCFGLLGGKYVASPRVGAQLGFAIDLPAVIHSSVQ